MARRRIVRARATTARVSRGTSVVLVHVRGKHGSLPARDLTGGDLNRLAYRRALAESGKRPPDRASDEVLEALADELVATGIYARPDQPDKKEPDPPAETPATPAEEPEA